VKTRTTAEGMERLRANHAAEIDLARQVARELCQAYGSTNSRLVRLEMERRGLISKQATKLHWLGAVFRSSEFEPTGEWVSYSSASVHERSIRCWRLRTTSMEGRPRSCATSPLASGSGAPVAPSKRIAEQVEMLFKPFDAFGAGR
jgi:hypothetical protein